MNLTRRSQRLAALLVAGAALFASCGASGGDDSAGSEAVDVAPAAVPTGEAVAADEEADTGGRQAGTDTPVGVTDGETDGRLLRRDAQLRIEVTDLVAATDDAIGTAVDAGGYLSSQWSTPTQSELVLRVPSDRFDTALATIAALGALHEQTVTTDDRTEVIIDLEARLATAQASLERTRSFFDQARTVTDLTTLERELATREAEVASLQAELDNERSAVALSTITATLTLESGIEPVDVVDDDALPGVADALSSGWNAIVTAGYLVVLVGAYLLPWLVPLLLLGLALRSLIRRRRARRPPPRPTMVVAAQPPPPGPGPMAPVSPVRPDPTSDRPASTPPAPPAGDPTDRPATPTPPTHPAEDPIAGATTPTPPTGPTTRDSETGPATSDPRPGDPQPGDPQLSDPQPGDPQLSDPRPGDPEPGPAAGAEPAGDE